MQVNLGKLFESVKIGPVEIKRAEVPDTLEGGRPCFY